MPDAAHTNERGSREQPPIAYDFDTADFEPDPARSYERAKPYKEYGHDGLDCPQARPCHAPDQMIRAVHNAHVSHHSESEMNAGAACPID